MKHEDALHQKMLATRREFGMIGVVEFVYGVRKQMRGAGLPWHLRRRIYKAIWTGIRFKPEIEMPPSLPPSF